VRGRIAEARATRHAQGHRASAYSLPWSARAAQRNVSGRRGVANAYGSKGVNAQCEYLITGPGMDTGACLFSGGAKYQMHFAG